MMHSVIFTILLIGTFGQTKGSEDPVPCTDENRGHCECGDVSQGIRTYVFTLKGQTRCFSIYTPPDRANEKLPVLIKPDCYAKDQLKKLGLRGPPSVAKQFGLHFVGLSTPDGGWQFGNNGVVNDTIPMPCANEDSKDIHYVRKVFEFMEARKDVFDMSKVYTKGFSQNAMFAAYIGFCFHDNVRGVYQAGSGMALTGTEPTLPGCEGQVEASVYKQCKADGKKCWTCKQEYPCQDCQYWPIYPCYTPKRPMIHCLAEYDNDHISAPTKNGQHYSSATYMYERSIKEGHDARLSIFSPSEDGTIKGGHKIPKNDDLWVISCLGIKPYCPKDCVNSFKACIEDQNPGTAKERADALAKCSWDLSKLGCPSDCAPTKSMMNAGEKPTIHKADNLFNGSGPQPDTSMCVA